VFGGAGLVYVGLFAVVMVVASLNYRRTRRMMADSAVPEQLGGVGAVGKVMPLMSFFTLFTVAVVPLAAALYVVTSTAWSAVERAVLHS